MFKNNYIRSVNTTICTWRSGGYKSEVVNRAWRLSLGFLLWGVWKERNSHIFRGIERQFSQLWNVIVENIRETILVERWGDDDWPVTTMETRILAALNLTPQMLDASLRKA